MRDAIFKSFLQGASWRCLARQFGIDEKVVSKIVRHRFAELYPEHATIRFSSPGKLRALAVKGAR